MTTNGTWHAAGDGGGTLRFERRLRHPVDKVWRAVTEPDQLAAWMPGRIEIEPRQGGTVTWVFPDEPEFTPPEGTVTAIDPPRLLEFFTPASPDGPEWIRDETLRFELSPIPEGCLFVLIATIEDGAGAASFAAGWQTCLDALSDVVDDRPVEVDESPESHVALFEEYMDLFALGEGTTEHTDGGWTVRFERQFMTHAVDDLWAALTADDGEDVPKVGAAPPLPMTNGYVNVGEVTEVAPSSVLEYTWTSGAAAGGRVRWELREGPGGRARVVLTQSGAGTRAPATSETADEERLTALAAWHTHLELLARSLRGEDVCPWPEERTRELREHYARSAGPS